MQRLCVISFLVQESENNFYIHWSDIHYLGQCKPITMVQSMHLKILPRMHYIMIWCCLPITLILLGFYWYWLQFCCQLSLGLFTVCLSVRSLLNIDIVVTFLVCWSMWGIFSLLAVKPQLLIFICCNLWITANKHLFLFCLVVIYFQKN